MFDAVCYTYTVLLVNLTFVYEILLCNRWGVPRHLVGVPVNPFGMKCVEYFAASRPAARR